MMAASQSVGSDYDSDDCPEENTGPGNGHLTPKRKRTIRSELTKEEKSASQRVGSDSDSDCPEENTGPGNGHLTPKRKRAIRSELTKKERSREFKPRNLRREWLEDKAYSEWLKEADDINHFFCKICGLKLHLTGGKSALDRHMSSSKHKKNATLKKSTRSVTALFQQKTESQKFDEKVHTAEIKCSLFFAEHNLAVSLVDDLLELIKDIGTEPQVVKNMTLGRTKCTKILNNVLCAKETCDLVSILKRNHFSILIDESTDITTEKFLCILVKYTTSSFEPKTELLELVKLDAVDTSAEKVYEHFTKVMNDKGIPLSNIIGLASDGANVMLGDHNSFKSRLIKDTKMLITLKCICHSAALVAGKACKELPRTPEDLIRAVANYVGGSAKRCAQLIELQEYFNVKKLKILNLATTRWLSFYECVERFLKMWDVLQSYFTVAQLEDKLKQTDFIVNSLNDQTKTYFYFLKYVLNYLNQFNALFQSKDVLVGNLTKESRRLFRKFGQNFLNDLDYNVNAFNPRNLLPFEKVFLGTECENHIKNLKCDQTVKDDIKKCCLRFYQTAITELQKRLPLTNKLFEALEFINISEALNFNRSVTTLEELTKICKHVLNVTGIEEEWRNIPYHFDKNEIADLQKLTIPEFWRHLSEIKDYEGKYLFQNICGLAKLVLALPHSNADSERIFSIISDVKCKKRNRIGEELLNSVCVLRSKLRFNDIKCVQYTVENTHFSLMKAKNLYS